MVLVSNKKTLSNVYVTLITLVTSFHNIFIEFSIYFVEGLFCDHKLSITPLENPLCASLSCPNGSVCIVNAAGDQANCRCPYYNENYCDNRGICILSEDYSVPVVSYKRSCICEPPFTGERCEQRILSCDPNPCYAGGKCFGDEFGVYCVCPENRFGTFCERTRDSICSPNPCKNGGECIDVSILQSAKCVCPPGYEGARCELKEKSKTPLVTKDPCQENNPCVMGICYVKEDKAACRCLPSWIGNHCDKADPCIAYGLSCENGGTCISSDDTSIPPRCGCPANFTGSSCEVPLETEILRIPSNGRLVYVHNISSKDFSQMKITFLYIPKTLSATLFTAVSGSSLLRISRNTNGTLNLMATVFSGVAPMNTSILVESGQSAENILNERNMIETLTIRQNGSRLCIGFNSFIKLNCFRLDNATILFRPGTWTIFLGSTYFLLLACKQQLFLCTVLLRRL